MILENKTVVISGVGPGLGREVARLALRDGARVVIGARRGKDLESTACELDPSGQRIAHRATDITEPEQCEALVAKAVERFGGVDALVQVAALDTLFGGLDGTSDQDWNNCFSTNVAGTANMAAAAAGAMKKRGGGAIVLIGSQSMYRPQVMQLAYASSKGALATAMKYMATELGGERIRVNMVVPTWMWGPPVQAYVRMQMKSRGLGEDEILAEITAGMPLGEMPADEDVAEAIIFFCSDRARMITGQALLVNSGELMHG